MNWDTLKETNPTTKLWCDSISVEKALLNKLEEDIQFNKVTIKDLSKKSDIPKKRLRKILNRQVSPRLDEFLVLVFIFDRHIGVK